MIRKKIFGEDHADVAKSYNNAMKPKNITKKHLWFKKIFGEDHADVATSYRIYSNKRPASN